MSKDNQMKIHITLTDEKGNSYSGFANLEKSTTKHIPNIQTNKPIKKRPTDIVREAHRENFFKDEKNLDETTKYLKSKGFNFGKSSVFMALQGAEYLKKIGTKGKFKFIQKYPPS